MTEQSLFELSKYHIHVHLERDYPFERPLNTNSQQRKKITDRNQHWGLGTNLFS